MRLKPNQMQAAGNVLTQVPEEPWATVCADFVGPNAVGHGRHVFEMDGTGAPTQCDSRVGQEGD